MRWTRTAQLTRAPEADGKGVWSRHPDAGVKLALRSVSDGGKRARSPGRARYKPVETTAQGRPGVLRWTCMLVCAFSCKLAHETAGAARTRSSLRPLIGGQGKLMANLGCSQPRDREGICGPI